MTNKKSTTQASETKVLVPVANPIGKEHAIKYLILTEEPKSYICEKGCVHEYPSKFQKYRNISIIQNDTQTQLTPSDSPMTLKRRKSPIAYKYMPSGKAVIPIFEKSNSIISSSIPFSADPSALHNLESNSGSKSASTYSRGRRSSIRLIQTSPEDKKAVNQGITQTTFEEGQPLGSPTSFVRNKSRRFLEPSKENAAFETQERAYNKHSNVFTRLYPFEQKPTIPEDEARPTCRSGMDWQNYHRLKVIYDFLDDLETMFPSLCTVGVIGHSFEGREIKLLKISNGNANNAAVWLDAGIHAREWIGPAVNTYVANHIARNFDKLPISVTNKDWYFCPVANPDGYEYTHTTNRMWRKSRAVIGGKCVGVDLNRNFSVAWGGKGSSGDPNHCFYRGPAPFSEPESCAIRDVLLHSKISFKVYITLHAFGEVIIFPLAHSDSLCPDYIRLLNGATVMSRAIYNTNGTTYKVGVSKDVMYRASGTSNDWCYSAVGIPYCYLIELRSKKHRFKLPEAEINETGAEVLNCLLALMKFVDTYPLEQNSSSGDHKRLVFDKEGQRHFIKSLDTVGVINIWKEEASTMDLLVEGSRLGQLMGLLREREIPYTVAVQDVGSKIEAEKGGSITTKPSQNRSMDWTSYHNLKSIYSFMENLSIEFPYLVTLHTIGQSVEGRNIVMLKVSNGKSGNTGVWIDGAIHPREWISVAVVTYFANALVRRFEDLPSSVTNKDWYLLPVLNPDGYEYTHTHNRMWRKNRAKYGGSIGVDLNRNFSCGWGQNGEEGSSQDPGNVFYRGPHPFSEPETRAVMNAIDAAEVPFKVFLSIHSYGEVIIFPWGYSSQPCPDYVELLEGGTALAKGIFESSGRVYKVGGTKDLMYYASGTSIDWSYGAQKIPFSYMIELRDKKHKFLLPKEEILATAQEVWNGVLRLMDFVDHRCVSTQHCVCRK
ncbi:hypothetical protein O0L34_g547 [Tuta absoluta]|nr:hypothetical protein O0L34_g547 [Tuta absoluta]